jgi:hypothetical protein
LFVLGATVLCLGLARDRAAMAQEEIWERPGTYQVWGTLSRGQKVQTITNVIAGYKADKGVTIVKEPGFYVEQIDPVYSENPALGDEAVGPMLRMLAIIFRDFDNGEDPEELIKTELGEERYQKSFKNKYLFDVIYQNYLDKKKK